MINTEYFVKALQERGIDFFTGVPDSLLKSFCSYIAANIPCERHITAVNEGAAVALGSGYYLASGRIPLIYMQNSGLGNALNPLLSLADAAVYSIPVLLLTGWRGMPGTKDEPQHKAQGQFTIPILEAVKIPYEIITDDIAADSAIKKACAYFKEKSAPFAFVVPPNSFAPFIHAVVQNESACFELSREEAIVEIIKSAEADEAFFSTTGFTSRELYELREKTNTGHGRDFLTVGSMGHCSSIALGAYLGSARKGSRRITCIDGDGAFLMHTGAAATIGVLKPRKFRHIVINNGVHDSVGGQPTIALNIDLCGIARAASYKSVARVETKKELIEALAIKEYPLFLEVRVHPGARADLGRPETTPEENKNDFIKFFRSLS